MDHFPILFSNGYQDPTYLPQQDPVQKFLHHHLSQISDPSSISHNYFIKLVSVVSNELNQMLPAKNISSSITEQLRSPPRIEIGFRKLQGRYGEITKKANGMADLDLNISYHDYLSELAPLQDMRSSQPGEAALLPFLTQRSFTWLHLSTTFLHELAHAFTHLLCQADTPRKLNPIGRSENHSGYYLEELAFGGEVGALFMKGLEGTWVALEGLAIRKVDGWHRFSTSEDNLSSLHRLRLEAPNFSRSRLDDLLDPNIHAGIFTIVCREIKVTHRSQSREESEKHMAQESIENLLRRTTLVSDKC